MQLGGGGGRGRWAGCILASVGVGGRSKKRRRRAEEGWMTCSAEGEEVAVTLSVDKKVSSFGGLSEHTKVI